MSDEEKLIEKTKEYVKELLEGEGTGHDFEHTMRVYHTARLLAHEEKADMRTVSLASLLHDVDDRKISPHTAESLERAKAFLLHVDCSDEEIIRILKIIREVSYVGKDSVCPSSKEGRCVQDADRLDAIGAIGIARAFAYGGKHGRALFDPNENPDPDMDKETYFASRSSTIGHFYEKLLLLERHMNTQTAKRIARKRTAFMESFLEEFYDEYDGDDIRNASNESSPEQEGK